MNLFSISQLAQYSGVKAHTIRMWEKRYNALKPERSEGNTRYYDNSQLRRLLNIVSLLDLGLYKVSELCTMPDDRLEQLISGHNELAAESSEYPISQLIKAGLYFDEQMFDRIWSNMLDEHGLRYAYLNIIYPVLRRVGMLWAASELPPASEHFLSNLIVRKLNSFINSLKPCDKEVGNTWVLALPEDEFHEIGLMFGNYLLREAGYHTVYLGANVPTHSISAAVEQTGARHVLIFIVHNDSPENLQQYLSDLKISASGAQLVVASDSRIRNTLSPVDGISFLSSASELEELIQSKTHANV